MKLHCIMELINRTSRNLTRKVWRRARAEAAATLSFDGLSGLTGLKELVLGHVPATQEAGFMSALLVLTQLRKLSRASGGATPAPLQGKGAALVYVLGVLCPTRPCWL